MEPKFIGKSKLTRQGQLTLPKDARRDLKIDTKSEVYWYEFNEILVLVKDLVNPKDLISLVFNTNKNRRFFGHRKSSEVRVSSRTRSQLSGFSREKKNR